ncbi:hypothetical protein ARMGADRAFT_1091352 [Armillaria gallica]|uniref:Uncharacterized protein n=1 Tax=Armillaria gallica TaxID=47427 RepID=A0A2H3CZ16_ARMGA|nr:hypothetical protein ARMGADRAFT_1091352 [Armillaria gallica]
MTRLPGKCPREGAGDSPAARRAHWQLLRLLVFEWRDETNGWDKLLCIRVWVAARVSKVGFIIRIDLDARRLSTVAVEGDLAACETQFVSFSSWVFTTFALGLDEPLEAVPFFFPPDAAMMTHAMSVKVSRIAGGVIARFSVDGSVTPEL